LRVTTPVFIAPSKSSRAKQAFAGAKRPNIPHRFKPVNPFGDRQLYNRLQDGLLNLATKLSKPGGKPKFVGVNAQC
jgi:hypothetical protein